MPAMVVRPGPRSPTNVQTGMFPRVSVATLILKRGLARAAPPVVVRGFIDRAVEGGASRVEIVETLVMCGANDGDASARFRVSISAPAPPSAPEGVTGYLRVLEVRARDEAHASVLARSLEPSAARAAIDIEECGLVARDVGPAGVLWASGRAYFGA